MYNLEKKIKFGVYGCCVSRDPFNRIFVPNYKEFFEISLSINRASLFCLFETPVFIDEKLLKVLPENPINNKQTFNIKHDFSRCFLKDLIETDIDYLIIDNYLEVLDGVLLWENNIITNNPYLPKTDFYKNLQNFSIFRMKDNPKEYFKIWKEGCNSFFKFLDENCPNLKIILNKARPIDKFLRSDGSIYTYEDFTKRKEIYSPLLDMLDKHIEKNFDVRIIEFDEENIFLDENHQWGKSPEHYTKEYYLNFFNDLQKIVLSDLINEKEHNDKKFKINKQEIDELNKHINFLRNKLDMKEKESINLMKEINELKK